MPECQNFSFRQTQEPMLRYPNLRECKHLITRPKCPVPFTALYPRSALPRPTCGEVTPKAFASASFQSQRTESNTTLCGRDERGLQCNSRQCTRAYWHR